MTIIRQVTYTELAELPLVKSYTEAFRKATGVSLRLVPAGVSGKGLPPGSHDAEFCRLAANHEVTRGACSRSEAEALNLAGAKGFNAGIRCFAGLQVLTAPVIVAGRHVATWMGGQVLCHKPGPRDFVKLAGYMRKLGMKDDIDRFKAAYFSTRVVPADRFEAMSQLLTLFAQHLGEYADRLWTLPQAGEPQCVTAARRFVDAHYTEDMRLHEVAQAAHVSLYHFCRVFRAATGITFTDYVARVRIERAKVLLGNPALRVSEVAYSAGFGSISQFNTLFRRITGVSPSEFRMAPQGKCAAAFSAQSAAGLSTQAA